LLDDSEELKDISIVEDIEEFEDPYLKKEFVARMILV